MTANKNMQEDIMKFQQLQQQLQALMMQKQTIQSQISEIENALTELDNYKDDKVFEVVGNVMIKKDKNNIILSLKDKKELLNLRVSTIDKQIEKLNENSKKLQEKFSTYVDANDKNKV